VVLVHSWDLPRLDAPAVALARVAIPLAGNHPADRASLAQGRCVRSVEMRHRQWLASLCSGGYLQCIVNTNGDRHDPHFF
jgi:hypothetical protein